MRGLSHTQANAWLYATCRGAFRLSYKMTQGCQRGGTYTFRDASVLAGGGTEWQETVNEVFEKVAIFPSSHL